MDFVTILILLAAAAGLIVYSVLPARAEARDTVRRRLEGRRQADDPNFIADQARQKAGESLARKAAPMLSKLVMPTSDEQMTLLRLQLTQAGYRQPNAQTIFLGLKTATLVVAGVASAAIAGTMGYGFAGIAAAVMFAGGLGFIAPGFWLGMAVTARQERLRRSLPDVLDLLVVSIESGLALDSGIKRVGEEMALVHPEVSEEFRIATMEGQMGIPRAEALSNMAIRVGIDELRTLVSVISQAERFGTSVGKALRTQAEAMRTKRRQAAEEKAQKTAVKLMIPLVLFIFPAMGVVLAGPAAIKMYNAFAK
jgi:tight adherence protein C